MRAKIPASGNLQTRRSQRLSTHQSRVLTRALPAENAPQIGGHILFIADTTRQRMGSPDQLVLVGEFEVLTPAAAVPVSTIPASR
jgi:hypothetical protein